MTPKRLAELPPIPEWATLHVGWWADISAGRTSTGFGVGPLMWSDLDAWCRFSKIRLTGLDVRVLRAIDSSWNDAQAKVKETEDKSKPPPATGR